MFQKTSTTRGFIGLLALLITVAIIMIVMFGSKKPLTKNEADIKEEGKSLIESQLNAVKKAEDTKKMLESRNYDFE